MCAPSWLQGTHLCVLQGKYLCACCMDACHACMHARMCFFITHACRGGRGARMHNAAMGLYTGPAEGRPLGDTALIACGFQSLSGSSCCRPGEPSNRHRAWRPTPACPQHRTRSGNMPSRGRKKKGRAAAVGQSSTPTAAAGGAPVLPRHGGLVPLLSQLPHSGTLVQSIKDRMSSRDFEQLDQLVRR